MIRYGYHGKVLHIDLSEHRSWIEEPDEIFWRLYGGGGLLATYYLHRLCPPGADALAPTNPLIFTSSVLAGHPYVGLARFTVAAKSPLTGGVGETRCEGPFGLALKGSGADTLIIHGVASAPTILLIENAQVTFHRAQAAWGQPVSRTVDLLEEQFGPHIHTAVIGPAGEQRVRFASIVSDRSYQAARMGMGAVMGSKSLKGLVICGEHRPPVADPATCADLTERYRQAMLHNDLTRWQHEPPGFAAWVHLHGTDASLCVRNYSTDSFSEAAAYDLSTFMKHYQHDGLCPGCPNNCIKFFGTNDHQRDDPRAGAMHQEITGTLGPNLGLSDPEILFQANVRCNDLGLDPTSLGFTLSMAMECVDRGVLPEEATGVGLRFGQGPAVLAMIEQIAQRRGFGAVLAEGAKRAAEAIGGAAPRYALHVKGLEMVCFEPRTQTNLALGYATAPIGPRYDICEHDWDFDTTVGWEHTLTNARSIGILQRVPMERLAVDKVRTYKALSTLWSGADALNLCIFAIAPTRVLSLCDMATLLSAVTGWETSSYEIMRLGERRMHLMRLFNLREGLTAADDTLPDRFFDEPIANGRWAGTRLDRGQFAAAVRTYYEMMGWDEAGRPRPATLLDHRLEWASVDVERTAPH